ncbi:MAG TPA: hypothetical protein VMW25_01015 [Clostridia bacterium]|nr:hypothetical protein [Clostridia bacterium]
MSAEDLKGKPQGESVVDLTGLEKMAGVERKLKELKNQGTPLGRETVLEVLENEQQSLSQSPRFEGKAAELQRIIEELKEHGEVPVAYILSAAGLEENKSSSQNGPFSRLRTLFRSGR